MDYLLNQLVQKAEGYRPILFWSWNDKLNKDLSAWQIKEMTNVGLEATLCMQEEGCRLNI